MTEKNYRTASLVLGMMVVAACILWVRMTANAQDAPPWVDVNFSIEAANFKDNLPRVPEIERELEQFMVKLCSNHFPFLRWRLVDPADTADAGGRHRLDIVLAQEDAIPLPQIVLAFASTIYSKPVKLPAIESITVHQSYDMDRPTHNPDEFKIRIKRKLKKRFLNEDFRALLHKYFLSSIPLSQRIFVAETEHRVIVPILWELLRLGGESVLYVDFVSRIEQGSKKGGSMKLSSIQKRWHAPSPGSVQGAITSLDFAPILLVRIGDWHEDIPRIFSGDVGINVYMEKYVEKVNLNTEAGLVTRPD